MVAMLCHVVVLRGGDGSPKDRQNADNISRKGIPKNVVDFRHTSVIICVAPGTKGYHTKTRKTVTLAHFCVPTCRIFAPPRKPMAQISPHTFSINTRFTCIKWCISFDQIRNNLFLIWISNFNYQVLFFGISLQ